MKVSVRSKTDAIIIRNQNDGMYQPGVSLCANQWRSISEIYERELEISITFFIRSASILSFYRLKKYADDRSDEQM